MAQSSSTVTTYLCLIIVTFILIAIAAGQPGNAQYTNRAARRMSKGCALWGQACLGGHFKKRAKEYPSSTEQAELNIPDSLINISSYDRLGGDDVNSAQAASVEDRLPQLHRMDQSPPVLTEGTGKLLMGWRPRIIDAGYRL